MDVKNIGVLGLLIIICTAIGAMIGVSLTDEKDLSQDELIS